MSTDLGPAHSPDPPAGVVRAATQVPVDLLLELTHAVRGELLARGEYLPPRWVEEAAHDLRSGRLRGWVLDPEAGPQGLAFLSARASRAYGHAHVVPGAGSVERVTPLLDVLQRGRPENVPRLDVGLTGLGPDEEGRLRVALRRSPDASTTVRFALEAPVVAPPLPARPEGLLHEAVRSVPLERLAAADWAAFQGTPDQSLAADSAEEDARVLEEITQGLLGRFLEEASTVLVGGDGAVRGFLLSAEQTPRRGIFLDLVVDRSWRGRGVGDYLLRWGLRALAALGYESVRLWVSEENTVARHLYDRAGFVPVGRALLVRYQARGGVPGASGQPH
jgi:ribosomal protein S18 acetylase RimI-like enzyme